MAFVALAQHDRACSAQADKYQPKPRAETVTGIRRFFVFHGKGHRLRLAVAVLQLQRVLSLAQAGQKSLIQRQNGGTGSCRPIGGIEYLPIHNRLCKAFQRSVGPEGQGLASTDPGLSIALRDPVSFEAGSQGEIIGQQDYHLILRGPERSGLCQPALKKIVSRRLRGNLCSAAVLVDTAAADGSLAGLLQVQGDL